MVAVVDHFCGLLHCKLDVAKVIGLLAREGLSCDLLDVVSKSAGTLVEELGVTFECEGK